MARKGKRHAQRALIVLGNALVGGARLGLATGLVGEQRAMIAQIVLRPVRLLRRFEDGKRLLGLALRLIQPGPRQGAGQLADGIGAGRLEMLVRRLVALRLELDQPHERVRRAMRGLHLDQLARQLLGTSPVALDELHQERLLGQHVVAGIACQRLPVVGGGSLGVVLASRNPPGKIAAEQRAHLASLGGAGDTRCDRLHSRRGPQPERCRHADKHRITSAHVTSCRES